MKLLLTNGYPFPYPADLSEAQQEAIAEAAPGRTLELPDVAAFEWKHTVTVQIRNTNKAWLAAQSITKWKIYDETHAVLEAPTSAGDGYDHPAIIVGDTAYCGFQLIAD